MASSPIQVLVVLLDNRGEPAGKALVGPAWAWVGLVILFPPVTHHGRHTKCQNNDQNHSTEIHKSFPVGITAPSFYRKPFEPKQKKDYRQSKAGEL
jgi:hypothetical protein